MVRGVIWAHMAGRTECEEAKLRAREAFRAGSSAAWPVRLLCSAAGADAFSCLWAYFRWADDIVDAPRRVRADAMAFVAVQREVLGGRRGASCPQEWALVEAIATPEMGDALRSAAERMMDALAWDAARGETAPREHELTAQIARIGDAYADAIWTATGEAGSAPEVGRQLARLATRAHHLRDLAVDFQLGYCNISIEEMESWPDGELTNENLTRWAKRTAAETDAAFSAALPGLGALPWRPQTLYSMLAWSYRRILTRPIQLPVLPS